MDGWTQAYVLVWLPVRLSVLLCNFPSLHHVSAALGRPREIYASLTGRWSGSAIYIRRPFVKSVQDC